jgi:hypothetical protein
MPRRRSFGEGVVEIGNGQTPPPGQAKIQRIPERRREQAEQGFRRMRDEPTESLEQKSEHARGIWL